MKSRRLRSLPTSRRIYLAVLDILTDSGRHAIICGKHPSKDPTDPGFGSLYVMILPKDGSKVVAPDTLFFHEDSLTYVLAENGREPVRICYSDPTLLPRITQVAQNAL